MANSNSTPPASWPAWVWPLGFLLAWVGFFGFRFTGGEFVDFTVQDIFWDGATWLAPREHPVFHLALYDGPKLLIILLAVVLIFTACLPQYGPRSLGRRRALYLLACLAFIPVVSTQLRAVSKMATPGVTQTYGGPWEHRTLFEPKPEGYPSNAFPAGHASGGFALIGFAYAWKSAHLRRRGIALALLAGSAMGGYQMARGEHFLSHTVTTGLLAWLMAALLASWLRPQLNDPTSL